MRISYWSSDVCSSDLIVDRYRDDLDALFRKFVRRARKSVKLIIAGTRPRTTVKKDHAESAGQIAGQMDIPATRAGKGKRGKDVAILQHQNCTPCLNYQALKELNDLAPLTPADRKSKRLN